MVTAVRLKCCAKCGGDLKSDEGDWRCWQCGKNHYSVLEILQIKEAAKDVFDPGSEDDSLEVSQKRGRIFGSAGDHNRTIERRNKAEARFWEENKSAFRGNFFDHVARNTVLPDIGVNILKIVSEIFLLRYTGRKILPQP